MEEMARMEDRLRALESRKRPRSEFTEDALPPEEPVTRPQSSTRSSGNPSSHRERHSIRRSIELDDSESSSTTITHPRRKRPRYTKGIKVTPSYTLKVSSSLREWGDWKRDIEQVFEGDPSTYQTGSRKILKALDYIDASLKSL